MCSKAFQNRKVKLFDCIVTCLTAAQAFVEQLHLNKQKWVPIVDPGIKLDPGYPAYDEGIKAEAFVQDFMGKPYLGQVVTPHTSLLAATMLAPRASVPVFVKAACCSQLLSLACIWWQDQCP